MNLVAASALSRDTSTSLAVQEVATSALAKMSGVPVRAAIVFLTSNHREGARPALEALRQVTNAESVIGCMGWGVLTEEREVEAQSAVALMLVGGERLAAGFSSRALDPLKCETAGFSLARDLLKQLPRPGAVVALAEPQSFDADPFFRGFEEVGGFLPVVGGVAASGEVFPESGASALALGGEFELATVVSQSAAPLGPVRLIMETAGNRILRLEGGTPLEVLKEALSTVPGTREAAVLPGALLAGVAPIVRKPDLGPGDFIIRNIVGADQESGAIAVPCRVAVGMKFAYHVRNAATSEEDLRMRLEVAKSRLGRRRIAFGLYFNCMGRGRGLYGRESVDVDLIREMLGRFPLAGFHGNGELAPLEGQNVLHNYTGVLALFLERTV